jgi:hypothetical protein
MQVRVDEPVIEIGAKRVGEPDNTLIINTWHLLLYASLESSHYKSYVPHLYLLIWVVESLYPGQIVLTISL